MSDLGSQLPEIAVHARGITELLAYFATCQEQLEGYTRNGEKDGVEGTQQMMQRLLDRIDDHLKPFRKLCSSEPAKEPT